MWLWKTMVTRPAADPPSCPALGAGAVPYKHYSFSCRHSASTVAWRHWKDTARGRGLLSPERTLWLCWVTVGPWLWPARGKASSAHSPGFCWQPRRSFPPSVPGTPASDFLGSFRGPACHFKLWPLSKLLHPESHTSPSVRSGSASGRGKGSAKPTPPSGVSQSAGSGCSPQLLVLCSWEMSWPLLVVNQSPVTS